MVVQAGCYFAVVWVCTFFVLRSTLRGANLSTVQRKNGKHGEKIRKIENISKRVVLCWSQKSSYRYQDISCMY